MNYICRGGLTGSPRQHLYATRNKNIDSCLLKSIQIFNKLVFIVTVMSLRHSVNAVFKIICSFGFFIKKKFIFVFCKIAWNAF